MRMRSKGHKAPARSSDGDERRMRSKGGPTHTERCDEDAAHAQMCDGDSRRMRGGRSRLFGPALLVPPFFLSSALRGRAARDATMAAEGRRGRTAQLEVRRTTFIDLCMQPPTRPGCWGGGGKGKGGCRLPHSAGPPSPPGSSGPARTRRSTPASVMAARRMTPPLEPSRAMARDRAVGGERWSEGNRSSARPTT